MRRKIEEDRRRNSMKKIEEGRITIREPTAAPNKKKEKN